MEAPRLVIVGGGIAGLAAARTAQADAADAGIPLHITLVEAADQLGGKIATIDSDGVALELGPDSFLAAKPEAPDLARELGLELVPAGPLASQTYLLLKGELRPLPKGLAMGVPTGVVPLLGAIGSGIISPAGALRAAIEPLIPRGQAADPSVEQVTERRLGKQVADRLVAPLVAGIFGAPPEEVSMSAAFPFLADRRSLVLAMAKRRKANTGAPTFLTVRGGLARFVRAIETSLDAVDIKTGRAVEKITRTDGTLALSLAGGQTIEANALVLATPASVTARLLAEAAPESASALGQVRSSASAVVLLRFARGSVRQTLDASGYLVAPEEGATVAACTWLPAKWPHHAWNDPWVRAVVTDGIELARSNDELTEAVAQEVSATLKADEPTEVRLHRWPEAIPILSPGHSGRIAQALAGLPENVGLAGAFVRGSGLSDCLVSGRSGARKALSHILN